MLKVNCETDFVSRNEVFKDLTMRIARGALQHRQKIIKQNSMLNSLVGEDIAHLREIIPTHDLEAEKVDNEALRDKIVSVVSQLGENIVLKRAVTIATPKSNLIGAHAHGNLSGCVDGFHFGKYAALVVMKSRQGKDVRSLCSGLSQHVIGMRPLYIDKEADHPEAEQALLNQEYLLDSNMTVRELLEKNDSDIVDFVRYQCGE